MTTWHLLGDALGRVGAWLSRYVGAVILVHGTVVVAVLFGVIPLFDLALEAAGVSGITTASIGLLLRDPIALLLLVAVILVTALLVLLEFGVLMSLARQQRETGALRLRAIVGDVAHVARRLLTPGALLLIPYLFLLVPLGGLGLASLVLRGIEIPAFITGELLKFSGGLWIYLAVIAVLFWLNLRLLLTVPALMATQASVTGAFRASWRATGWQAPRLAVQLAVISAAAVVLLAGFAWFGLVAVEQIERVEPAAAVLAGGIVLALLQGAAALLSGLALAAIAVLQSAVLAVRRSLVAALLPARETVDTPTDAPASAARPRRSLLLRLVLGLAVSAALVGGSAANAATIIRLGEVGDTAVLAHRGDVNGGVENSIEALEAAAAAGADVVEMDVQRTRDGGFVVIHDATLGRLAGLDSRVDELTVAELAATEIRVGGQTALIPSLEAYLARARVLEQPLLIELKPTGREPAEFPAEFLAFLDEHPAPAGSLVQSLDGDLIEELAALDPGLPLGYVIPLNLGHLPETPAVVLVVEDFSYSRSLLEEAHAQGKQLFVWTLNTDPLLRAYLREGVDGVITDLTADAVQLRSEQAADRSVISRVTDLVAELLP